MINQLIGMIAACDRNNLIGYDGKIPFKKPEDLKRFKQLTINTTVIVGSTTWKTLQPKGLPGREVIVVTNKLEEYPAQHMKSNSIKGAIGFAQCLEKPIWLIGGSKIYQEGFEYVDFIDLTIVDLECPVEDPSLAVYFPTIPENFTLQTITVNKNDSTLTHLKYIKNIG